MKDWRELQQRVCALFNSQPGFVAEENKRLQGARSNVTVDVFVRHVYGPLAFTIVVECKAWNVRVPQEKAFALKTVVDDLGASMGILLTEKGIQAGCERYVGKNTNLIALQFDELETLMPRGVAHVRGVDELELLLNQDTTTEYSLVQCFQRYPHLLLNLGYELLIASPVLQGGDRTLLPDFILKPVSSPFCDLLEIKSPATHLLLGQPTRRRLSAAVAEAASQLRVYDSYFSDRVHAELFYKRYGVLCYKPRLLLLAGRSPSEFLDMVVQRDLELSWGIRLITFDQLLSAARSRAIDVFRWTEPHWQ